MHPKVLRTSKTSFSCILQVSKHACTGFVGAHNIDQNFKKSSLAGIDVIPGVEGSQ